MPAKIPPGLIKRGDVWHIDKSMFGQRICESCRTTRLDEACALLNRRIEELRLRVQFGVRIDRSFEEAAIRYVNEFADKKRSIHSDVSLLSAVTPYIGHLPLRSVNRQVLEPIVRDLNAKGRAPATINKHLGMVRRILNLAASEWMDDDGMTWLESAPKIKLLPNRQKRKPYPLTWVEQDRLFAELPEHLRTMALFAVNTCCRDGEICNLRWEWEVSVPQLDTFVFRIPENVAKNGRARFIILNDIAKATVDEQRGRHNEHVFGYEGHPVKRMLNSAWCRARRKVELPMVRVHDLRHTGAARLRAAGVSHEDRAQILGHVTTTMTEHYSAAYLQRLLDAVNRICGPGAMESDPIILR